MLAAISPNIKRPDWRSVCWAVLSTKWDCASRLVREWSIKGELFSETDLSNLDRDFKPGGGIGFGTLVYFARQHGYDGPTPYSGMRTDHPSGAADGQLIDEGGDVENGRRFAGALRGRLICVSDAGWYRFDEASSWHSATFEEVELAAKEVLDTMGREAAGRLTAAPRDPAAMQLWKEFKRTSRFHAFRAMIELSKSEPGMSASLADFDADPMLLGVANGVLDLQTSKLRPVSPEVRVSKRCTVAFDQSASCPRFEQFLVEIQPDVTVRDFLQRFIGYCLTGSVDEQVFALLHGSGGNGKSVLIELIYWLLGDYALKVSTDMLMHHQRSSQAPDPDIVALKGKRFVYANETEEGRRLSDARVKDMTGGDTLTGRVPYAKSSIKFEPTFKLVMAGNHKPEIADMSQGMWRRVLLIPFEQTIPVTDRNPELLKTLKTEGPGILNWALAGLRAWRSGRLCVPASIKTATDAYGTTKTF